MEVPEKTKSTTTIWPSNSTPGYIKKKQTQNTNSKTYIHPNVHSRVITIAKIWRQPKCHSTYEWIKKMWYVLYTMEYYSSIKNDEILPFCNNMGGLGGHYTQWNKSEKDKYCMISLICGI